MDKVPSFEQVLDAQNISTQLQVQHWLKYELFTPQFWLLISILIIPWILWWRMVDKRRFLEIIIYGLLISTVVTVLDEVGCQLNWWDYRYDIEPLFPRLIPMNFSMLPVGYMLVYQNFTKWKSFVTANIVLAAVMAFIGEPLFAMTGIYVLLEWKIIYSFPIYIILALVFKVAVNSIMKVQQRYRIS
ncbi:MAG: hypothetical protein CVU90_03780 [Firmicutes bacterium HGW-Firmicutes-15]|nr:MAG: hypothetical protein CVU90_03780 [Firmicutes bacterium HGW-Firmicutes-15]